MLGRNWLAAIRHVLSSPTVLVLLLSVFLKGITDLSAQSADKVGVAADVLYMEVRGN